MAPDDTISLLDDHRPRRPDADDTLILVLDAARPLAAPRCLSLAGIDEVLLGRGPMAGASEPAPRQLRVDLADSAVSSLHARLTRAGRGWTVSDEQSKNGTLLNGQRVASAPFAAADLLELGNCFFVLRRSAGAPAIPLRTLHADLAYELGLLDKVARSTVPILFTGETGTGKEVLARAAHELSGRAGPFVAINCGAIPPTLVESELFGARKGAFSGADADRLGLVASAHRGTLFLDEIAELPETAQAALLRVLQDGEVMPLGATRPIQADLRVMAATHQDLDERVAAGAFRADLYARLRGHRLTLPPLRERREDLGVIIATLLPRVAGARAGGSRLQRAAARALLRYDWPYNVRELEQTLARAVAMLDGDELTLANLPREIAELGSAAPAPAAGSDDERERLLHLLRVHGGNLSAVARALHTSRSQLRRVLARHQLAPR